MKRLLNFFLLIFALSAAGGMAAMTFSRQSFEAISSFSFPQDGPLMGSTYLDLLIRPEFGVFVLLVAAALFVKEFLRQPLRRRILLNLGASAVLMALGATSVYGLYIGPASEGRIATDPPSVRANE